MSKIETKTSYEEEVLEDLLSRQPGFKYDLTKLEEPARYIAAVKNLIDGGWLNDIEFNADYTIIKKVKIF